MNLFDALVARARGVELVPATRPLLRPVDALALVGSAEERTPDELPAPAGPPARPREAPAVASPRDPSLPPVAVEPVLRTGVEPEALARAPVTPASAAPEPLVRERVIAAPIVERSEHHHHHVLTRTVESPRERVVHVGPEASPREPSVAVRPGEAPRADVAARPVVPVEPTRARAPVEPAPAPSRSPATTASREALGVVNGPARVMPLMPRPRPEPAPSAAAPSASVEPVVHVHIDRIIVRAEPPAVASPRGATPTAAPGPDLLTRYLADRSAKRP